MRDALLTPRTRRFQLANIIAAQRERTATVQAGIARLVAAGALAAIDAATFGLLHACAATDSVSITAGRKTLTSPDLPWVAADVGKVIHVAGAGAAGAVHVTRIAGFTLAGEIELADAAATTVAATKTSAAGLAAWGWSAGVTDDGDLITTAAGDAQRADLIQQTGAAAPLPLAERLATAAHGIARRTVQPVVLDLHYRIMRGASWAVGEADNAGTTYTLDVAAAAGDTELTFDGDVPVDLQLLAYIDVLGRYRTVKVLSVAGQVATLCTPLEAAIAAGPHVFAFFANYAHPNVYGYRAIMDYALAGEGDTGVWPSYIRSAVVLPVAYNGGAVALTVANDAALPGSANAKRYEVTPGGASQGCKFTFVPPRTGRALVRLRLNTGGAAVNVLCQYTSDHGVLTLYNQNVTNNSAEAIEIPLEVCRGVAGGTTAIMLYITREADAFTVSPAELLMHTGEAVGSLNQGKHVLFGDSWFANPFLAAHLAARLPAAQIVNKGVGGRSAFNLAFNYAAEVAPEKPDFVWIMVGTNDAFAHFNKDDFAYYLRATIRQVRASGAVPILFLPSVCDPVTDATAFDLARVYAEESQHFADDLIPPLEANASGTWTPVPTGLTVSVDATYAGFWRRIGNHVFCQMSITPTGGGTTASLAGTTTFGGLPFYVARPAVCKATDSILSDLGNGQVSAAGPGAVYAPTWVASIATIYIDFDYEAA